MWHMQELENLFSKLNVKSSGYLPQFVFHMAFGPRMKSDACSLSVSELKMCTEHNGRINEKECTRLLAFCASCSKTHKMCTRSPYKNAPAPTLFWDALCASEGFKIKGVPHTWRLRHKTTKLNHDTLFEL